ncbi:transposase, partial [Sinorhizobium meliloti]|uniref:transposase n=1 Tax=Rhizobium meliloti TaxID=382 RepID=UPI001F45C3F5
AQARYAAGTREILECWFEGRPIREEYLIVSGGNLAGAGAHSYSAGDATRGSEADAGYAYTKVFAGMEQRAIEAVIPAKAEPIRSPVPMRRFRYDAKHDTLKCPRGKMLKAGRAVKHGRFFTSRAADCRHCDLARLCLSNGRVNKAVVLGDDYPALLRARRRRERWSDEDRALYQRHRWRSEGYHGEAKTWHGLSRAIRRGLINMKTQAYLTAAAVNLKRLASAFLSILLFVYSQEATSSARHPFRQRKVFGIGLSVASA